MTRIKYIVTGVMIIVLSHNAHAAWLGSVDIFAIGFGSDVDQVAVEYGDTEVQYVGKRSNQANSLK